jgi:hypothetical protein
MAGIRCRIREDGDDCSCASEASDIEFVDVGDGTEFRVEQAIYYSAENDRVDFSNHLSVPSCTKMSNPENPPFVLSEIT